MHAPRGVKVHARRCTRKGRACGRKIGASSFNQGGRPPPRTKKTPTLFTGTLQALGIVARRDAEEDADEEDERFYDLQACCVPPSTHPSPSPRNEREERASWDEWRFQAKLVGRAWQWVAA